MTLNYSHRTYFPLNLPEENLVSSVKDLYVFDGMSEKNVGVFGVPQYFDWNWGNSFDFGNNQYDKDGSFESVASDISDLLPPDPFGMGISATITAIAGWVEDFESERVNFGWNRSSFQTEPVKREVYQRSDLPGEFHGNMSEYSTGAQQDESAVNCKGEKHLSFNYEDMHHATEKYTESGKGTGICSDVAEGAPHDALLFALGHLGLKDLLSVRVACKSLYFSIDNDSLLWRNINIHKPSCSRINDEALLKITGRAQGYLLCLSLDGCSRISDDCLKVVLDNNPRLRKLNVKGCTGLSVDGIVNNLKDFKLDHLRIGNRYITWEQFVKIKRLVDADKLMQLKSDTPYYYRSGHSSPCCDEDCAIDIEVCPRCENPRLVYDCPAESCKGKQPGNQMCRACTICIPRCGECGRCVNDTEYDETFCLEKVCSECRKRPVLHHIIFYDGVTESSTRGSV